MMSENSPGFMYSYVARVNMNMVGAEIFLLILFTLPVHGVTIALAVIFLFEICQP